ncbi:MAG: FAD/NAD(P)-binding protein [Acidobacteriota bacterium]|nr:MAG: FAD/NAD(P)-binding protein [Acidobacteriota bacterium]
MKRITIIGGGASGILLALNILKLGSDEPVTLNLVERSSRLGRGVAFGTENELHLLNVPAGRMGAFADDVGHFHKWLQERELPYGPDYFVPRVLFGEYLRSIFATQIADGMNGVQLNLVDDEAIGLSPNSASADVILRSGEVLPSDKVVLAFGNFDPPHPNVPDLGFTAVPKYFGSPWDRTITEKISPDDSVLIIGTGLSMVDVVIQLTARGQKGRIYAISTRGLLPARHKLGFTYPSFYDEIKGNTRITDILKTVRRHIRTAHATGSNWRAVIDRLRPHTQQIWMDLPTNEKRYFMQHLSRYWNVARHRMPAEVGNVLDELQKYGKLAILKGRLKDITYTDGVFDTEFSVVGERHHIQTNAIVNCIGSECDYSKLDSDLVRDLLDKGVVCRDELCLGLEATPDGSLIDNGGKPSNVVFTLGTAMKGILWESTAIPEIRGQAHGLAQRLVRE